MFATRRIPQSQPIPNTTQVQNNAGGYVFQINDFAQLERFLILGSDSGTYYCGKKEHTVQNAQCVLRCIKEDGLETVRRIVDISVAGRAPKNDPAIFALAMCAGAEGVETRRFALDSLSKVCRTGTHLFQFFEWVQNFRGRGRMLQRALKNWYLEKDVDALSYQLAKYQQRNGISHKDIISLVHPYAGESQKERALRWAIGKTQHNHNVHRVQNGKERLNRYADVSHFQLPEILWAYDDAKTASKSEIIQLILRFGLTHEMIPNTHFDDPDVWNALLQKMPLTAMIRNLATMTRVGLLGMGSDANRIVIDRLSDAQYLKKSRVHPISVMLALDTYNKGVGFKGGHTWKPVPQIIDALDDAFYLSFGNVEPTGKRTMLALDVSGSMGWSVIAKTRLSARVASAAMAMATAKSETEYVFVGFCGDLRYLPISKKQRLDDVCRTVDDLPFGRTDCALPMTSALKDNLSIDTFVVYTDNETWAGGIHPSQALEMYRQKTGIDAKLVVVGMTSTGFSIADPKDHGMMDVVGFDASAPQVIGEFARG